MNILQTGTPHQKYSINCKVRFCMQKFFYVHVKPAITFWLFILLFYYNTTLACCYNCNIIEVNLINLSPTFTFFLTLLWFKHLSFWINLAKCSSNCVCSPLCVEPKTKTMCWKWKKNVLMRKENKNQTNNIKLTIIMLHIQYKAYEPLPLSPQ